MRKAVFVFITFALISLIFFNIYITREVNLSNISLRLNCLGNKVVISQWYQKREQDYYRLICFDITSHQTFVIYSGEIDIGEIALNPKNNLLLFTLGDHLCLFDLDDKKYLKKIPIKSDKINTGWYPNGKAFYYYNNSLVTVKLDNSHGVFEFQNIQALSNGYRCLCWDREERKALLTRSFRDLNVYDSKTQIINRILLKNDFDQAFFANNNQCIIYSYQDNERFTIGEVNIKTRKTSVLFTTDKDVENRLISADSSRILFSFEDDNGPSIYCLELVSGKIVKLKTPRFYSELWDYNYSAKKILIQPDLNKNESFLVIKFT